MFQEEGVTCAGSLCLEGIMFEIQTKVLEAWGWCTGMTQRDGTGGRKEEGSEWGTHVYLWRIHVDIWQNQYNIVKLKNKIKK